ncbi:MAG TPA: hypothetical protein VIS72_16315 [Anaerolineales bacterium]
MQPFVLISLVVFGLIVVGALIVFVIWMRRSSAEASLDDDLHPQGYWIGIGISIGAGFGVALGLVFDNLALGIAMGAGMGVAIGSALEQRNKDRIRPLTEQEKKMQKWGVALGLLMLLIFVGLFAFLLFIRGR